ncbi:MAG: glycosyltransferase family 2 protein [Vicingaceae bacterium]
MSDSVVVIIPCYNEDKRLAVEAFLSFCNQSNNQNISFLFVNDGSSDNTIKVLSTLEKSLPNNVHVLDLKKNVGKAEAIRKGMLYLDKNNYSFIGYFDADLATPLEELENLIAHTKKQTSPYLVMGSRVKLLGSTEIKRKMRRHYIGRIFATVVSNMLNLPVYDTQCGAKVIKSDIVESLFEKPFLSKWLFDVELLFRLKQNYPDFENRIVEVPLKKWEDKDGSKIGLTYFLRAPFDLLKIYFKYSRS